MAALWRHYRSLTVLSRGLARHYSSPSSGGRGPNSDYVVSESLLNRNPRNLEWSGIEYKSAGWELNYPNRTFYHKILLEKSNRHLVGKIVHWTGREVVRASTREYTIRQHLYSSNDVSAAMNIGRILGARCIEAGITSVHWDLGENTTESDKEKAFREALVQSGIELREPEYQANPSPFVPGIDYEKYDIRHSPTEGYEEPARRGRRLQTLRQDAQRQLHDEK